MNNGMDVVCAADTPDQTHPDLQSSRRVPLPTPQIGLDSIYNGNDRREENAPCISVPPSSSLPEIITFPSLDILPFFKDRLIFAVFCTLLPCSSSSSSGTRLSSSSSSDSEEGDRQRLSALFLSSIAQ